MQNEKVSAARLSIFSNLFLVLLKGIIGVITGSVAVSAEAIHSGTDLLASFVAYLAVRAADAPPDESHPYGHGKIESFSGLGEAILILLGGGFIAYEAIRAFLSGHETTQTYLSMGVMAFSAILNMFVARYLHKVAKRSESIALEADAHHLSIDVFTSLGVFTGLLLVIITGKAYFDPLAALLISLLTLHTGYSVSKKALAPLLDTRLPEKEVEQIIAILKNEPQVLSWHKLRTRRAGSERHVDLHIQLDDDLSLRDAHAITEALEDAMRAGLPNLEVIIHPEPYEEERRHQEEVHHRRV
jgi:cation diffusion facilitator family transporter